MLARNTLLNLVGQLAPLVLGAVALPVVVRALGLQEFGLLSLAWSLLGYFTIFDLGLSAASTRFVAEALGSGRRSEAARLVGSGMVAEAILGCIGGVALWFASPLIATHALNMPPELAADATDTFHWLAITLPVVLVSSMLVATLQGAQRFGILNAIRIPASSATYLLPLLGVLLGMRVGGIIALILISRLVLTVAMLWANRQALPGSLKLHLELPAIAGLLRFGGWVTVTATISPLLVYSDRFFIGSLVSAAAVGFYSVPSELVTRLAILPLSVGMTVFPAVSAMARRDLDRLQLVFARSTKLLVLTLSPVVLFLGLFGGDALRIWLGSDFAAQSSIVLQILAVGTLANLLSYVPIEVLKGLGRPDLPAKMLIAQLPLYLIGMWFFTSRWGLAGAATVWTLRMVLNTVLLFVSVTLEGALSPAVFRNQGVLLSVAALLALTVLAIGIKLMTEPLTLALQSAAFVLLFGAFVWITWRGLLDALERGALIQAVQVWRR